MEVALLIVGALALYALACLIWPYTACGRCAGGKRHSPTGQAWRSCPRCHGSGKKLRLVRRILGGPDDT